MKRTRAVVALGAIVAATALLAAAGETKACDLKFLVIRDYSGKPVRNASVVMHEIDKLGRQAKGGLQLKTDADGKTAFEGVPYGKLRIQVLATGFQTFGEDYDIHQPAMEITVRLKRPGEQYSIYESKKPDADQKKDDKKNEPKDDKQN